MFKVLKKFLQYLDRPQEAEWAVILEHFEASLEALDATEEEIHHNIRFLVRVTDVPEDDFRP